ncbi:MAG: PDZ domain-containing protein [Planctomycetes bacterium]|nr:PDZ domain-containing protein [Planctomycetota bacterium]
MRLAFALCAVLCFGGGKIEWSKLTLDEALEQAKAGGHLVLAYFASEHCGFCAQQDAEAFSDDDVVRASEAFIRVKVDCSEGASRRRVKTKYGVTGTPTVLILDGEGNRLAAFEGLTSADAFAKKFESLLAKRPGVAPSAGPMPEDRVQRIVERVERELAEAEKVLREEIVRIVRSELGRVGVAKAVQPPPALEEQIERWISRLSEEGVTGRLKAFLSTPQGREFGREALEEQGVETLEDFMELYFEPGADGTYGLKEEFREQVEQLLDQMEEPSEEEPESEDRVPGYLGILPAALSDADRARLGLKTSQGLLLDEVRAESPAEKAGLKAGDVLVAIDGKVVTEENLPELLSAYAVGDAAEMAVLRDGRELTVKVTFGARP